MVADPENGHSVDSRVKLGTLGHHHERADTSNGSDESTLADYANDDGEVDSSGLGNAFSDWQSGEISSQDLGEAFSAWQSGDPVV
ncbi:hypothetical protein D8S78_02785 [Natrialba swarupiae]|nr:hypothetical protein [Natrialba swarupiae]